jgi:dihydropyrimidinase
MNMDHSAYEGTHVDGRVVTVLSRGRVVVENDTFTGSVGHGKFLRRGLSQYLI